MKKTILVTGGAGYVGSQASYLLASLGCEVIILDKLLHKNTFNYPWAKLIVEDFGDKEILKEIFSNYNIHAVMHFAALIEVGESVNHPSRFYDNNLTKTLTLLDSMLEAGVKNFIFSSSCAVYGDPISSPMDEKHPRAPINAYGKNKLAVEFALEDYSRAYDLKYVALRYFNAAGAFPEMGLGEMHDPESHVIPILIRSILNNQTFSIFGSDYPTSDGSALRDYIHVRDIADAHIKALHHLEKTKTSDCFNLGSGHGYTVLDLIKSAEVTCSMRAQVKLTSRRDGDAYALVANPSKARDILGWQPKFSNLDFILKSAFQWEYVKLANLTSPTLFS